jgi:hypothetical protein
MKKKIIDEKTCIGWREWVCLPDLAIPGIKAKIDTGARTSSIHASDIEVVKKKQKRYVRFTVFPLYNNRDISIECQSEIIDERKVTDSGGKSEIRYFIKTDLVIGERRWEIDVTLTNRENMRFRMLLGREALAGKVIIDPRKQYLAGRVFAHVYDSITTGSEK